MSSSMVPTKRGFVEGHLKMLASSTGGQFLLSDPFKRLLKMTERTYVAPENDEVGFRDDTSYLTAHYGSRSGNTTRSIENTEKGQSTQRKQPPPTRNNHANNELERRTTCQTHTQYSAQQFHDAGHGGSVEPAKRTRTAKRTRAREEVGTGNSCNVASLDGAGTRTERPSLSEQLASIGKAAEGITAAIRKTHGLQPLEGALLTTPSRSFLVGKLKCKYPSPVYFFKHKCVYNFHHPFEATTISMEMFYRDMRSCGVVEAPGGRNRQMRFKIDHPLCHYREDYAHENPSHFVAIDFSSRLDAQRVEREIMPLVQRQSGCAC